MYLYTYIYLHRIVEYNYLLQGPFKKYQLFEMPPALIVILDSCLHPSPTHRPKSMSQIIQSLEGCIPIQQIEWLHNACPPVCMDRYVTSK